MCKMFDRIVYYAFILGLILGRMTNIIGVIILSTIVVFIIDPAYYSYDNLVYLKNLTNILKFKLDY